jgi:hypothetical protein
MKIFLSVIIFGLKESFAIKDCPSFTGSGSSIGGFTVGSSPY